MDVLTGILRGMGASMTPTIITLIGACGTRVLWILCIWQQFPGMHEVFGSSLAWLYVSYPVSWFITILAQVVYALILYRLVKRRYIRGHWNDSIQPYVMPPIKSGTSSTAASATGLQ
jgi:Na+-driven multidrug efflux pump